jgi:hypothetical protein
MSQVTHEFYTQEMYVKQYPDCPNAVARVTWVCVMKRNGAKVIAAGRTELPPPDKSNFISIDVLDAPSVMNWVIAQEGGDAWVSNLVAAHEPMLNEAESELAYERWRVPLINSMKYDPNNA